MINSVFMICVDGVNPGFITEIFYSSKASAQRSLKQMQPLVRQHLCVVEFQLKGFIGCTFDTSSSTNFDITQP